MASTESRLERLALQVADGTTIDWDRAEREANDRRERAVVHELRALAELSDVHRTLQRTPTEGALAETLTVDTPRDWGDFEILEKVGKGSFGDVFRARDRILDREVALKLLRIDARSSSGRARAVLREGRLMARVKHPNVATIYGADERDGRVGLWMEFVEGKTLGRLVKEAGPFSVEETVRIGIDVCRAVQAVHDAGILHRDIKAQNVMREANGRIVLMDFGVGRDRAWTQDETPTLSGTPLYLAPELLEGKKPTVQSDVYSVGVLLYYLATANYPVVATSIADLRSQHRTLRKLARSGGPFDFHAQLSAVAKQCLAQKDSLRFKSAESIALALSDSTPLLSSIQRTLRKPHLKAAASGTIAITTFAVAVVYLSLTTSPQEPQPPPNKREADAPICTPREVRSFIDEFLQSEPVFAEPLNSPATTAFARGKCLQSHSKLTEAIPAYERAVELEPELIRAHLMLADAQAGAGKKSAAFDTLRKAFLIHGDDDSVDALWLRARFHLECLQYRQAEKALLALKERSPGDDQVFRELALLRDNQGLAGIGVAFAKQALSIRPEDEINNGVLTLLYAIDAQPDRALATFERWKASHSSGAYPYWGKGIAHLIRNEPVEARKAFKALGRSGIELRSFSELRIAETLAFEAHVADAIRHLQDTLAIHRKAGNERNYLVAKQYLAEMLFLMGRQEEALNNLQASKNGPRKPYYLRHLRNVALLAVELGRIEDARILLQEITHLSREYRSDIAEAIELHVFAAIHLATGRLQEGHDLLQRSRTLNNDTLVQFWLARAIWCRDAPEDSRTILEDIQSAPERSLRDLSIVTWLRAADPSLLAAQWNSTPHCGFPTRAPSIYVEESTSHPHGE